MSAASAAAAAAAAAAARRSEAPSRFSSLGKRRKRGSAPSVATRPFFGRFAPALPPNLPHSRFRPLLRLRFNSSTMRSALHASATSSVRVSSSAAGLAAFAAAFAAFASTFVARDGRGGGATSEGIERDSLRRAPTPPARPLEPALSVVVATRSSCGGSSAPPSGSGRWMLTSTIVAPAFTSPLAPPPPPLLLLPTRGGEPPRPRPLSALLAVLRGAAPTMRASTNSSSAKLQ